MLDIIGEAVILDYINVEYGNRNSKRYLAIRFPKDTFNVQNTCATMHSKLQDMGIDSLMKEINGDYYLLIVKADLTTATQ